MKQITIEVAPDGTVKLEGVGFQGKECDAKMKAFEDALGKVEKRTDLPSYHATVTTTQNLSSK